MTEDWLKHTARILGNLIGAPEPASQSEMIDTLMRATLLDPLANFFNNGSNVLLKHLEEA